MKTTVRCLWNVTILLLLIAVTGHAQTSGEIFSTTDGAIRGYDPVAFFTEEKPVKGTKDFTMEWNGAAWHFVSKKNLDMFKADPEKYAPQYGGYCAYGAAEGHKAPTQTDTWTVLDNKLYFNYNKNVQREWLKDTKGFIEKADANWPNIKKE
jgi:YHS domain-containing protein